MCRKVSGLPLRALVRAAREEMKNWVSCVQNVADDGNSVPLVERDWVPPHLMALATANRGRGRAVCGVRGLGSRGSKCVQVEDSEGRRWQVAGGRGSVGGECEKTTGEEGTWC